MKKCKTCGLLKAPSEFYRHSMTADKLRQDCKKCHVARISAWKKLNRDKVNQSRKRYRQNPEKRELIQLANRLYRFRKRMARKRGA